MLRSFCFAFILLSTLASLSPAEDKKPFMMNISLPFAEDATILLELPVPETGKKYKKITVDHFRKHGRLLMYLEYQPVEIKVKGLTITKAVFHLPKPPLKSEGPRQDIVKAERKDVP